MIRRVVMTLAVVVGPGAMGGGSLALGRPGDDPKPSPPVLELYRTIVAEYEAQKKAAAEAIDRAKTDDEQRKIYSTMAPDDVAFSRRMVDLAASSPKDPASRDALLWVLNKRNRRDIGPYGDEFARAVRLLVDHHVDDPEAVRVGLQLDNNFTHHRDALMEGMYANAEAREAKGLARMALARYLQGKAEFAQQLKQTTGKMSRTFDATDVEGRPIKKTQPWLNELQGYVAHLRMLDPQALRQQAEALYEEVLSGYGDIPYITSHQRYMETILKDPIPMWNYKPMAAEEVAKIRASVEKKRTLSEVAAAYLDEMHHLTQGQAAPEIDGKDLYGRPMKLSDFRGKVVVLVFWGSWCGPCMREVPHERQLLEKYRGKPFAILGVNCREKAEVAKKTVEREKMTWPQWSDGEEDGGPIVGTYHIRDFPTLFVIDAKGVIRQKDATGEELDRAVDDLMKNMPGA